MNSNLALQGQPTVRFLSAGNKLPLSRQDTSLLASNIRLYLDEDFSVRSTG